MKKTILTFILYISLQNAYNQNIKYSSAWFGPNANPVPEFTDATIPTETTVQFTGDYYFGYGDQTKNGYLKIEVPLLPERVSFKIWTSVFEHYRVTESISDLRQMNGVTTGKANGDFYVQTRISLLKENKKSPAILLNSTLKTASGTNFKERRYFDTPGYYFDLEIGKSFIMKNNLINEIRLVGNVGFLCWETTNSVQDDAPIYGAKIIIGNNRLHWENTLSGYYGWMHSNPKYGSDYGDTPLVYATKFNFQHNNINYFTQYQYGIKDLPYHQLRVGVSFSIKKLTPQYVNKK
ncbi:MAG: hypothetical protein VB102_03780 [Paludibacter sp.]|nr:hypothetical protein [Paludibacter sp.]